VAIENGQANPRKVRVVRCLWCHIRNIENLRPPCVHKYKTPINNRLQQKLYDVNMLSVNLAHVLPVLHDDNIGAINVRYFDRTEKIVVSLLVDWSSDLRQKQTVKLGELTLHTFSSQQTTPHLSAQTKR